MVEFFQFPSNTCMRIALKWGSVEGRFARGVNEGFVVHSDLDRDSNALNTLQSNPGLPCCWRWMDGWVLLGRQTFISIVS